MNDLNGRPYAKLSQLSPGNWVEVDADFTCMKTGLKKVRSDDNGQLFIDCRNKGHFLTGQLAEDGDSLIGIYVVEQP